MEDRPVKAGVIGLGQIGAGVAVCLARANMLAAVYDTRPDAADGFSNLPPLAASPAEVAAIADVVILAVVNAQQVIAVLSGSDGVLAAARPEHSVVLLSTVSIPDLNRIRDLTDAAGIALIDSGVSGGPKSHENGLICMVGADDETFDRVLPVLKGFARRVAHMGGPGAGMAAKIARNVVAIGCLRAGYEGAALAQAAGVDVQEMIRVIDETADAGVGPMFIMGRPKDPGVDRDEAEARERIRQVMLKDAGAALALGRMNDVALPLIELIEELSFETFGLSRV